MDYPAQLRSDISEIRDSLLSSELKSISPPDLMTHSQMLLVNSYIILAHAHIEEFVEDVFSSYLTAKLADISDTHVPRCFIRLAMHFSEHVRSQNGSSKYPTGQICASVQGLYEQNVIKANNGLKDKNVISLGKPLGFLEKELSDACSDLFPALNTLGSKRGALAHKSVASQAAAEIIYPSQALSWVADVVDHFHQLSDFVQ